MATSLIIEDGYTRQRGRSLKTYAQRLDDRLATYVRILEDIKANAIKDGAAAESLDAFISYVKSLEGELDALGKTAYSRSGDFISSVDTADENLY